MGMAVLIEGESSKGSLYTASPWRQAEELAHFHRFTEIAQDRCYRPSDVIDPTGSILGTNWSAVYNFVPNPKAADYSAFPEIHQKMLEFNSCYSQLLAQLHAVFNGSPGSLGSTVSKMFMLGRLAKELM